MSKTPGSYTLKFEAKLILVYEALILAYEKLDNVITPKKKRIMIPMQSSTFPFISVFIQI